MKRYGLNLQSGESHAQKSQNVYFFITTLGRLFLRHLILATLANFWKSLNLSGAKIKISLFFFIFSTKRENGKKIKHITTDQYCVSTSFSVLNTLFCY